MPLPKNEPDRKKMIDAALALKKLPPEHRKALMEKVMRERGLHSRFAPNPPEAPRD